MVVDIAVIIVIIGMVVQAIVGCVIVVVLCLCAWSVAVVCCWYCCRGLQRLRLCFLSALLRFRFASGCRRRRHGVFSCRRRPHRFRVNRCLRM